MAGASIGVTYLTLAYLIEIAVVVNLAYRELKFPELNNKLHERVGEILVKAKKREIGSSVSVMYKEYGDLKALIEENGTGDQGQWGNKTLLRSFFNNFIRTRRSLNMVNFNIMATIIILVGCTIAAGWYPSIENVYWLDNAQKWIWFSLLIILVYMTFVPLLFIRMATLCEKHLLGFDNNSGLVQKMADRMFMTKDEEDAKTAALAKKFAVLPSLPNQTSP